MATYTIHSQITKRLEAGALKLQEVAGEAVAVSMDRSGDGAEVSAIVLLTAGAYVVREDAEIAGG